MSRCSNESTLRRFLPRDTPLESDDERTATAASVEETRCSSSPFFLFLPACLHSIESWTALSSLLSFRQTKTLLLVVAAKGKGAAIFEIAKNGGTAGGPEAFLGALFAHFGKEMLGW